MTEALWFAGGAFCGALIMAVWVGSVAHNNYERFKASQAALFGMEQSLLDCLEGNTDRMWQMRSDGVDVVVERKRPDLQRSIAIADHEAGWVDEPLKSEPRGSQVIKIESELEEDTDGT